MSVLFEVEKSFQKSRWVMNDAPLEVIERVSKNYDLPEAAARLLISRNIAADDIPAFLNPTLKDHLPSPFFMKDMEDMAGFIADQIIEGKNFAIFGDFDVDGATSSAILYRFLKELGKSNTPIYIPDRLSEGYGPNIEALQKLKDGGADTLFVLDCGSTAFDIIGQGRKIGLDIVIFDHHQTEERLTDANFTINPKRPDDSSGLDMLAACGVTFMGCIAINNKLREKGFYQDKAEPKLMDLLDLVALGTVCDMVPLTHVNRLLVRSGFKVMQNSANVGLNALMEVSRISSEVNTQHAGFMLGPRINAGSRIHKADLGARLLSTDDHEEAINIAWTLNDCNEERKAIQAQMEKEALHKVEAQGLDQNPVILVGEESWHPGLSGLVAGRIKDKFGKPACVVTYASNLSGMKEGRGSGRSIPGINIGKAFMDAMEEGLLLKGGGHAMAGGFTVAPEKLDDFQAYLNTHIARQAENNEANSETAIDGVLTAHGVRVELIELLEQHIGPFGQDFPEPLFAFRNVRLHNTDIRGGSHISVLLSDWEGGTRVKAMAFGAVGTDMGEAFLKNNRRAFDIVGKLKINDWQGRKSAEIHIQDACYSSNYEQLETACE
ncbi:MAG: single-stranded-DNA-specific exonuclease RecJ [Alphaproteobacteria bacterium]